MDLIRKYFPNLTPQQDSQLAMLGGLYAEWNVKINTISRKDIQNLYERHILSSLSVAKVIRFKAGTRIIDVGTGGGFPGIPLAILFPEVDFMLIDSVGKKIKVVEAVAQSVGLTNVHAQQIRFDKVKDSFDFVISRAVTKIPELLMWSRGKISPVNKNDLPNGILYLKGGDFEDELSGLRQHIQIYQLSKYFEEDFYETKKLVHLWEPARKKRY